MAQRLGASCHSTRKEGVVFVQEGVGYFCKQPLRFLGPEIVTPPESCAICPCDARLQAIAILLAIFLRDESVLTVAWLATGACARESRSNLRLLVLVLSKPGLEWVEKGEQSVGAKWSRSGSNANNVMFLLSASRVLVPKGQKRFLLSAFAPQ